MLLAIHLLTWVSAISLIISVLSYIDACSIKIANELGKRNIYAEYEDAEDTSVTFFIASVTTSLLAIILYNIVL